MNTVTSATRVALLKRLDRTHLCGQFDPNSDTLYTSYAAMIGLADYRIGEVEEYGVDCAGGWYTVLKTADPGSARVYQSLWNDHRQCHRLFGRASSESDQAADPTRTLSSDQLEFVRKITEQDLQRRCDESDQVVQGCESVRQQVLQLCKFIITQLDPV